MSSGLRVANVVDRFRKARARHGVPVHDLTDEEVISLIGRTAEEHGDSVQDRFGQDFRNAYLDVKNKPERGIWADVGLGLKRQTYGTISGMARGAQLLGELGGSAQPWLAERAEQFSQKAAEVPTTSIERPTDIRLSKPGEILRGGATALSQVIPSVVEGLGMGLVGGGVA